jgi:hypothetical protein
MYTIIVTGSRHYHHGFMIESALTQIARAHNFDVFVKVGDCNTGVDSTTQKWCDACLSDDKYRIFEADWGTHGKAAGPIRNHEMVDSGGDICIAWPLEDSKGTKDCAQYAASKGMEVWFPDLPAWAQWAVPIATLRED